MKKKFLYVAVALTALTGCVNNDYDLSDIDTTTRINVNNLTVPLQIAEIKLDDMLDLYDDDQVKKSADGEFIFLEEGELESDPIFIDKFTANGIGTSTHADFDLIPSSGAKANRTAGTVFAHANIPHEKVDLNFEQEGIDEAIVHLDKVGLETTMKVTFHFTGLETIVKHLHINGLKLKFIDGLSAKVRVLGDKWYDCSYKDGVILFPDCQTSDAHTLELEAQVSAIDANKAGIELGGGHFKFKSAPEVLDGEMVTYMEDVISIDAPSTIGFDLEAHSSDITITEFSGRIKYSMDNFHPDPISLTSLPDVLSDSGTNIELTNPQIYLSVNNPVVEAGYSLFGTLGLQFTNNDNGNKYATADDGIRIDEAQNNFCLSPMKPESYYVKAANMEHVGFPGLGKILSGNGIPKSISVDVLKPCLPEQNISGFRLGESMNAVKGKWTFMAPLSLTEQSVIKYSKEWTDWQDDDLDKLVAKGASVMASINTNVQIALEVDITLLGRSGELKGKAVLVPGQNDFVVNLDGQPVSKIYGAKVDVRAAGTGKTLSPNQTISISNLKVKFDGYYETDF